MTDQGALDGLLARRDVLIGCLTYDGMRHELDREINRSARQGLQLSVCVVDFDSFKSIDDDVGPVCPDAILALVAGILRTSVQLRHGRALRSPRADRDPPAYQRKRSMAARRTVYTEGLPTQIYSDRVDHPGAPNKIAVVASDDDDRGDPQHALIRNRRRHRT